MQGAWQFRAGCFGRSRTVLGESGQVLSGTAHSAANSCERGELMLHVRLRKQHLAHSQESTLHGRAKAHRVIARKHLV
jgi:hypothetical protein